MGELDQVAGHSGRSTPPRDNSFSSLFLWNIPNFSQQMVSVFKKGQYIDSENFMCGEVQWYLRLFPRGQFRDARANARINEVLNVDFIGLYLGRRFASDQISIFANFRLFVLNSRGEKEKILRLVKQFPGRNPYHHCGEPKFMVKKDIFRHPLKMMLNDVITVGCELSWSYNNPVGSPLLLPVPIISSYDENLYDYSIIVGEKRILTNKELLCQKSQFFHTMCHSTFDDAKEDKCVLQDVEAELLEAVIKCAITGVFPDLVSLTVLQDWFIVADRFNFSSIRSSLEKALIAKLEQTNTIQMYIFSDFYNASNLKKDAKQFICSNWNILFNAKDLEECNTPKHLVNNITENLEKSPVKRRRLL